MSITIVFSTKKIDPNYIQHLKDSCKLDDLEILPYENNGQFGLTKIYNDGLKKAKNDIIVFCHDDLIYETPYWGKKLLKQFKRNPDYGIIGVAGTNLMNDGCWWGHKDPTNSYGIVNHIAPNGYKYESMYSPPQGNQIKEMVALDGLFIAVNRNVIKNIFNEEFNGFHFYDITFCLDNYISGVKIGLITDIRLTHKSVGKQDANWHKFKNIVDKKYEFPIQTNEKQTKRFKFP